MTTKRKEREDKSSSTLHYRQSPQTTTIVLRLRELLFFYRLRLNSLAVTDVAVMQLHPSVERYSELLFQFHGKVLVHVAFAVDELVYIFQSDSIAPMVPRISL